MGDFDEDIEELESRLYSQVYHSNVNYDLDGCVIPNSSHNLSNTRYKYVRYFRKQDTGITTNRDHNFIPLGQNIVQDSMASQRCHAANFFNVPEHLPNPLGISMNNDNGFVPQPFIHMVNPCNNILVLPPTPQLISSGDYHESYEVNGEMRRVNKGNDGQQRGRNKYYENVRQRKKERRLMKMLREVQAVENSEAVSNDSKKKGAFTIHHMNESISFNNSKEGKDTSVVTISDSEDSCVELPLDKEECVVLSSGESDEEHEKILNKDEEIKNNSLVEMEEIKSEGKPKTHLDRIEVSSQDDDDDEIVFIENIADKIEVIEIDCDTKSVTNMGDGKASSERSLETSTSTFNSPKKPIDPILKEKLATKDRNELLKTPDSTSTSNDFLDTTIDLQQKKFNFGLHDADFNHAQSKSQVDRFETESSCSASDHGVAAAKTNIFNEIEFESPDKDLFNEDNLEKFGDYIMPNRSNRSGNTSTPINSSFERVKTKAGGGGNAVQKLIADHSDSSSESDYEEEERTPVKHKKLPILTSVTPEDMPEKLNSPNIKRKQNSSEKAVPEKKLKGNNSKQKEKNKENIKDKQTSNVEEELCEISKVVSMDNRNLEDAPPMNIQLGNCVVEEFALHEQLNAKDESPELNKTEIVTASTSSKADQEYDEPSQTLADISQKIINDLAESSKSTTEIKNISSEEEVILVGEVIEENPNIYDPNYFGFSKYWTTDMNKFYNTSWGLENFNVGEMQKTMSNDQKLWRMVKEDHYFGRTSQGRRGRCRNCQEFGHIAMHCRNPKRRLVCALCSKVGHTDGRCPEARCTSCGSRGIHGSYCSKCAYWKFTRCRICSVYGHVEMMCPDIWRRYHLTVEPGPIVQPQKNFHRGMGERWCSACANAGHYENACKLHPGHHSVEPHVVVYYDVYNFPKEQPFVIRCVDDNATSTSKLETREESNTITGDRNTLNRVKSKDSENPSMIIDENPRDQSTDISRPSTSRKCGEENSHREPFNPLSQEAIVQITFDSSIFPPIEMIPEYFRARFFCLNERQCDSVAQSPKAPENPEHSCPHNVIEESHQSITMHLTAKLYGFIHSKKGTNLVNELQRMPDISLTVTRSKGASQDPTGTITVAGSERDVRDARQRLLQVFTHIPLISRLLPESSKPMVDFLGANISKIDKIVGDPATTYQQLLELDAKLLRNPNDRKLHDKIKSITIHLNMLLFGKLKLAGGNEHVANLRHWYKELKKKEDHTIPLNIRYDIFESYSYIFTDTIRHRYDVFCKSQGAKKLNAKIGRQHKNFKELTHFYKLVESKCRKLGMFDHLKQLKLLKGAWHSSSHSIKAFKEFMTFCNKFLHSVKSQSA